MASLQPSDEPSFVVTPTPYLSSAKAPAHAASSTTTSSSSLLASAFKPILAGALTGAVESAITYPTEYVKTHLQLQSKTNPAYNGIVDCVRKTVRSNGVLGLYRGFSPTFWGSIPKQASRWATFETCSNAMCAAKGVPPGKSKLTSWEVSLCGLAAGTVEALLAVVPTETIKTRLIHDQKSATPRFSNLSLVAAITRILRTDGVAGVYRGVSNTVMKQGVNQSVRFPVQHATMNIVCSNAEYRRKAPLWNGCAGFFAGIVSVYLTQPFDVLKTRMQGGGHLYRGTWHCFRATLQEGGLAVFYAGAVPRMLRVGGNVALTFTLFPIIKSYL